ncbi:hypothetical protein R3W88_009611 [Solanum pinnatisectum]|uniref:F-box domain-containing protein n=1 Tax=Solanum pinnatisectum TaxID=50273 RepID=A0AAV9MES4_9SOLN|nr:hypothetical protein R3W88_009611 [Solanum pinnatisectum]
MAIWSQLDYDMLFLIGRRLNLIEDYLNFGSVCKSWRCAATKDNFNSDLPRSPWLILYNGMILNKRIPKASGKRCMESMGWFITVGKEEGEINLLHPFSGVEIELPHQNTTNTELVENGSLFIRLFYQLVLLIHLITFHGHRREYQFRQFLEARRLEMDQN